LLAGGACFGVEGVVGIIDEASCRKWGDETPGVQRQYLGFVGKVDNGIAGFARRPND
jgi:SRSO17 transposase